MPKAVHHVVKRPGRKDGAPDVEIPVAEDLVSEPGIPQREVDVAFYSREYPIETQNVEKTADREWVWTVYTEEMLQYRKEHDERNQPLVEAASVTGDIEPTAKPDPGRDITEDVRLKARELGFGEVGFTRFDRHYAFVSKKGWVQYEHAICLAYEQDYAQTQTIPSLEAEFAHFGTYETEGAQGLELADYIRSLGYHAQVHSPNDNSAVYIPMFVQAGLGQLGANGQLLSPHFGSRARLMIITTDGPVSYDEPVDYGIHRFCQQCQVCVNRCPGRALVKEKVWWRGVEKNKLIYDRCRPVMARYEGCAVCMKVCPVQRYGMKPVMEHYIETGEVLGKGTENLEGYTLRDKGHFGPGELPQFDRVFFDIPHGRREDWLFEQFKDRLDKEGVPPEEELVGFATKVKKVLEEGSTTIGDE
uniref:Putative 4Fe-4S binding domain protein n=1 Tax=uncultured marine microorganism HF4000_APKG8C21 TaxID=455553 RepID=B3TA38_9ZZZZ|nr:putative 4Fe-4S binding domain protein [uncultured marine microorganism HF4000_APKG8C21]